MKKLSNRSKKAIFNYVNSNFYQNKIQLDKYFLDISDKIIYEKIFVNCTEEFIDCYCDNTSEVYEDLARSLVRTCSESKVPININIQYEAPYYNIENTKFGINSFKGNRNRYLEQLNNICSFEDKVKGRFYEEFCNLFLKDIGIKVEKTSYSKDDGIDIFGKFEVTSNFQIIDIFFCREIYLLAQVKFYNYKVDTPVIRQIIGDSLFYKFNNLTQDLSISNKPLLLVVFSHNGFYENAKKFAQNNSVILFDSSQMIDMLCNLENVEQLSSIKYLNSYK